MQVVDHVTQSQYALQLLLPQADYAAALDIIADIQVSTVMLLDNALIHMSCLHQCTHLPSCKMLLRDVRM